MAQNSGITVALTGSTYFEHPLSVHRDEAFLALVELMRGASATFANLECAIPSESDWPAFGSGMGWAGTYMGAPPSMIDELKFLGVDAVYAANNHVADFDENGILNTVKNLRRGGMPFAGIGASLTEASEPCYVETDGGRVAMIAAADWGPRQLMELPFPWPAGYMPSDELPPFHSRPGVNLVRYEAVVHVDREAFDQLRRISGQLDWEKGKVVRREGGGRTETLFGPTLLGYEQDTDTEFFFMGRKFVLDDGFRITTFAFQEDLDRIYKHVREARRQADVVIVALHDQSHARGVLDFIDTLAHGVIDAGADLYINHGGMPRGIEIYKGKAILYGQPGFHLQNDQITRLPSSMLLRMGLNADSSASELLEKREGNRARAIQAGGEPHDFGAADNKFIQVAVFEQSGGLKEIRIHPIAEPVLPGARQRKGVPQLLDPESESSERVLEKAIERSKPFGTTVEVQEGVGVVRVN